MSAITEQIFAGSKGMLTVTPEEADRRYSMFNGGSVEVEVAEFLYGLVRMIKPAAILETGTHKGISAVYMALALKDNDRTCDPEDRPAFLHTIEFEHAHVMDAQKLIDNLGLGLYVEIAEMPCEDFKTGGTNYDLIFLDTEPQTRFAELVRFEPFLSPGGYVLIHDLHSHMHQIPNEEHGFAWPYGPVTDEMQSLVKSRRLVPTHFANPRGMTMFYKPRKDTFRWG